MVSTVHQTLMQDASVRSYSTKQNKIATDAILQNPQDGEDCRCIAPGLRARLRNALGAWLGMLACALVFQSHAATAPLKITSVSPSGGSVVVRWEGGTGPFQLLCRTNFADAWQKAGPVTSGYSATVAAPPGPSCFFLVTTDVTPPPVPTGLRATTNGCGQITVTWNMTNDAAGGSGLKSFRLYQGTNLWRIVPAYTNTTIEGSLAASTTRSYAIEAEDWAGNFSARSTPITGIANCEPIAIGSASLTNTVPGIPVTFDGSESHDLDGEIRSYLWTFGDGSSNTQQVASHPFNSPGTYYVHLKVTDNFGASSKFTTMVSVATPPPSGQFLNVTTVGVFNANDAGQAMKLDGSGNLLVAGSVWFRPWLAKRSASGETLWTATTGGVGSGSIQSIAIDANNDILITGHFYGTVSFGATTLTSAGGYDIFLAKCSANGGFVWARRFGSSYVDTIPTESGTSIAVNTNDNFVVFTGYFDSTVDFGGGPMTSVCGGDLFLAKFNLNGTHVWSKRVGGANVTTGTGAVVDGNGGIYICGTYSSVVNFGSGPVTNSGLRDMFFARYTANGSNLWVKTYGPLLSPTAMALDGPTNLVLTGFFQPSVSIGGPTLTNVGYQDIFLAKYSTTTTNATHVWSKRFGGAGPDYGYGLAVEPGTGRITLTGTVRTAVDFGGGSRAPASSGQAAFVANFTPTGAHRWSTVFGGGAEEGRAVAFSPLGKVFVTGRFAGTVNFGNGPVSSSGMSDLFLAEFTP